MFIENNRDWASLILRVGVGGLMLSGHGLPKLKLLLSGKDINFIELLGLDPVINLVLAIFAEFLCSILLILGLKTRLASIPLIITMLVAAFYVNLNNPLLKANADGGPSKEFPLMYLLAFLAILLLGSGRFSLDSLINKKKTY